jgi:hypothetical protein
MFRLPSRRNVVFKKGQIRKLLSDHQHSSLNITNQPSSSLSFDFYHIGVKMHFTTILASAIALAMGASAMPAPPADTRYAQLRLFGEPGCSAQNEGELGVYGDYVNKCNTFPGDTPYRSVSFEYAINNCSRK